MKRTLVNIAVIVAIVYVMIYLFATQQLIFTSRVSQEDAIAMFKILPNWKELLIRQRSPFLFEPVGILYLGNLRFFISAPNIILAFVIGGLVGANISASYYTFKMLGLKGVRGVGLILGTIPVVLSGAACCVPTIIIIIGLQLTATLAAVWSLFVPISLILLTASLYWSVKRIQNKKFR